MITKPIDLNAKIPAELAGKRLDVALGILFPQYSRARLQSWVKDGWVKLDGAVVDKSRFIVVEGQEIELHGMLKPQEAWQAQPLALDIVYEDDDLIIINKPPGLVVHPGAGNMENTLLNALLHHAPELAALPRAGIIHRLDKDTSGLLVIAKTLEAYTKLVSDMQERKIKREYEAVISGVMTAGGVVDAAIARHPRKRTHMAVVETGKDAITHYRVLERFRGHTHVRLILETGRTHQIRVHMAHIHYPVVGDQTYGGRMYLPKGCSEALRSFLKGFKRQALHAARLELHHPISGKLLQFSAPIPDDVQELLRLLREDKPK